MTENYRRLLCFRTVIQADTNFPLSLRAAKLRRGKIPRVAYKNCEQDAIQIYADSELSVSADPFARSLNCCIEILSMQPRSFLHAEIR